MRKCAATLAIMAMLIPGVLRAAEPPCLTAREFAAVSSYAMPAIIDGTVQRCGASLSPDSFLRRKGADLVQRYAVLKPRAWPSAKPAILKLIGSNGGDVANMLRTMPDTSLQPMADAFVSGAISQKLPLQRCGAANRVVELLSPLPPESAAELIALAAGLGARSGQPRIGMITICPA
ncbi:MAG: hypothetical protein AB7F98_10335 [Novosphingobium sp.]